MSMTSDIVGYFKTFPDENVSVENLGQFGYTELQIKQTVADIIRENRLPGLKVVEKAKVWIYDTKEPAEEAPSRPVKTKKRPASRKKPVVAEETGSVVTAGFHQVGITRKGELVLEDLSNNEVILARRTGWKFE